MRRYLLVVLAFALVATVVAGCAQSGTDAAGQGDPETSTGQPGGDGLHSTVPDVVGLSVDEATTALEDAGYEAAVTPEGATGEVTGQEPVAGFSAPRGEQVELTVEE